MPETALLWTFTSAPTADPQRNLCILSNRTHYLWTWCRPGHEHDAMWAMLHEAERE